MNEPTTRQLLEKIEELEIRIDAAVTRTEYVRFLKSLDPILKKLIQDIQNVSKP